MPSSTLSATGLALLRVVTGLVFIVHGWQKYSVFTIGGTTASFEEMGVPFASIAAPAVALLEVAGGAALVLGLLTRVFGALLGVTMAGALALVHVPAGFFVTDGGFEFVMVLGAAAFTLALVGPGRFSLDHAITGRSTSRRRALA